MLGVALGRVRSPEDIQVTHFERWHCPAQPFETLDFTTKPGTPFLGDRACCQGKVNVTAEVPTIVIPEAEGSEADSANDIFAALSAEQLQQVHQLMNTLIDGGMPAPDPAHPIHQYQDHILEKLVLLDCDDGMRNSWLEIPEGLRDGFLQKVWDDMQVIAETALGRVKVEAQHLTAGSASHFHYIRGK